MLDRFKSNGKNTASVAIWPTDHAIATAMIRPRKKGLPILEFCEYLPVKSDAEQGDLLAGLVEKKKLGKIRCISLMGSDAYHLLMVEAPEVPREELQEAMRWRIKDLINFPVEQAVIDVFDIPDQKSSGDMMYVVVAKEEDIAHRARMLLDAGFNLEMIDIMELAMKNVASLLPEDEHGVALVWLGLYSGSITLTKKGVLYFTRHLGGAEKLFDELYSESITAEMEGWLDTVVIEIQRTLDFYESQYGEPPVAGVVLVPLIKPIEGVAEYLASQLGIKVGYLDLEQLVEMNVAIDDDTVALCLPAIGAALEDIEVNT